MRTRESIDGMMDDVISKRGGGESNLDSKEEGNRLDLLFWRRRRISRLGLQKMWWFMEEAGNWEKKEEGVKYKLNFLQSLAK